MDRMLLNEHDANQGAQSRGEFLGMTGNSGWYLLGSMGASLLMVIVCWGILGVSLLVCLVVGVVLCGLAVAYVFTLKNNRPEHYATDFFESALIEAGVIEIAFGPRQRRIANPFMSGLASNLVEETSAPDRSSTATQVRGVAGARRVKPVRGAAATPAPEAKRRVRDMHDPVVPLAAYEHVRDELDFTEEMLEDALAERAEAQS